MLECGVTNNNNNNKKNDFHLTLQEEKQKKAEALDVFGLTGAGQQTHMP